MLLIWRKKTFPITNIIEFVETEISTRGTCNSISVNEMKETNVTLIESSPSKLMKRSRPPGNGVQVPSCLVDGCNSDLGKCKDYHRRHKVCEPHSKTPKVTICGQEKRFCQQCSRFHSLVEFDDRKRSCRKRLDGHNRRRRKPQSASMSLNTGRFLYGSQGPRFLPIGSQLLPTSDDVSSSWMGTVKPETNAILCGSNSQFNFSERRKNMLPASLVSDYEEKQLAISCIPIPIGVLPKSSTGQPFLDNSYGFNDDGNIQKVLANGLNRFFDSDCALSLLSTPFEIEEINLSSMVQSNLISPAHYIHNVHNHNNSLGLGGDPVDPALVSDGSGDAGIECYSTFHMGPDGSTASEPHQTLFFSWD